VIDRSISKPKSNNLTSNDVTHITMRSSLMVNQPTDNNDVIYHTECCLGRFT